MYNTVIVEAKGRTLEIKFKNDNDYQKVFNGLKRYEKKPEGDKMNKMIKVNFSNHFDYCQIMTILDKVL